MRIIFLLFLTSLLQAQQIRLLHENWSFSEAAKNDWKSATVPGVVHTDLLKLGLIKDPWFGTNEKELQWIEDKNWIYRCSFTLNESELQNRHIDLLFEGLDTYAEVSLNGKLILSADNMFRSWRLDVKSLLISGINKLEIVFKNPGEVNKPKLAVLGYELPAGSESVPIKVSPFTRKAPYHFGWDWGPRFVTSGIWKPVKLEFWNEARIEDLQIIQKSLTEEKAVLEIQTKIRTDSKEKIRLHVNGKPMDIQLFGRDTLVIVRDSIMNPELWWPNGWGKQKRYPIIVKLEHREQFIDRKVKEIGLRTIELVQDVEKNGRSFYFKVNGIPIFIKGANYIPQSHFLPSVTETQYRSLIEDAQKVNMNMLRVWGGGIYENDIFYDLCDEKGILVWQDFMFAGSMYPGDSAFVNNVKAEVREQISRLRHHPCIALWNGNNEMEVAWFNWGWQKQFGWSAADSAKIRQDYEQLFHKMIPDQIRELDPERFYTPTSPLSNWGKMENFNYGSMHYWGVWHGKDNFEDYRKYVGRFMSEYGFQSFPEMSTIRKFAEESQLSLDSEVMKWHQKSYVGNGMIAKHAEKYFAKTSNFEDFANKSQQTQALAMQIAIDAHRIRKGHCWGTLYWQYNDCWPGPSWSSRDVYGNWKQLHKDLKVLFAPLALIPELKGKKTTIWLSNDLREAADVDLEVLEMGKIRFKKSLQMEANGLLELYKFTHKKGKEFNLIIRKNGAVIFERKIQNTK